MDRKRRERENLLTAKKKGGPKTRKGEFCALNRLDTLIAMDSVRVRSGRKAVPYASLGLSIIHRKGD